ncbi:MAG: hypothetical protein A2Y38_12770 [Spirochaetes bacterium GWB1_59_5]|nr:MAG: hypothetical protein A2Y38_12770 [Spirochaetes bacterium GWB1_59_5]
MITVKIGEVELKLTKNEAKEAQRLEAFRRVEKEYAQRSADIWIRSAPTTAAQDRRKAVARALGLSDTVAFL